MVNERSIDITASPGLWELFSKQDIYRKTIFALKVMEIRWFLYGLAVVLFGTLVHGQTCSNDTKNVQDFEVVHVEYRNVNGNYPRNTTCMWIFKGTNITFQIANIYIGADDALYVYDGNSIAGGTLLYDDTDGAEANTKGIFTANTDSVIVLFTSGPLHTATYNETGFDIYVLAGFDNSGFAESTEGEVNLTATTTAQVITSPKFPLKYPKKQNWKWNIRAPGAESITVNVTFMDVEFEASCNYDYLKVSNATGSGEKLCANDDWTNVRSITINGDEAYVELKSDEFSPQNGFIAFYVADFRFRELGEDCSIVKCGTENSKCSNKNICICEADFYRSGASCKPKKNVGEACTGKGQCRDPNAKCDGSCKCVGNHINIGGICKLGLDGNCSHNQCAVPNVICNENKVCVCDNMHYRSGDSCKPKKNNGEDCTDQIQCLGPNAKCTGKCTCIANYVSIGGYCKLGLGGDCVNVQCGVPNSVCDYGICKCNQDHYQEGYFCKPKKDLNFPCTANYQCKDSRALCFNGRCVCSNNYVNTDGVCKVPCNGNRNMIFCPDNNVCYCRPGTYRRNGRCYNIKRINDFYLQRELDLCQTQESSCPSLWNMHCCKNTKSCECKEGFTWHYCGNCIRKCKNPCRKSIPHKHYFPHCRSAEYFIQCDDWGYYTERHCPPGLIWSQTFHGCVWHWWLCYLIGLGSFEDAITWKYCADIEKTKNKWMSDTSFRGSKCPDK